MKNGIKQTAMQELIERINFKAQSHVDGGVLLVLSNLKIIALQLLEKEKEQICNAYTEGLEGQYIASEYYYNVTYNK
jgi:hypothetical protein